MAADMLLHNLRLVASFLALLILSSLPLHLAVQLLKGKTGFWRGLGVGIYSAAIPALVVALFQTPIALLSFVFITFSYSYFFRLSLAKAFLVWITHYLILSAMLYIVYVAGVQL